MIGKPLVAVFLMVLSLEIGSIGARAASEKPAQSAEKEGRILIYGGATLQHMTLLIGNFNRIYPRVKVEYLRKSGNAVFEMILRELRTKTYNADAYVAIGIDHALYLAERKLLAPYPSPERASIPEPLKDREGYWTTLYQTGHVYAYNTRLVDIKDVPRSYEDFLQPKWKGKILMDGEDDLWFSSVLEVLGKEKGVKFMRALAQQQPQFQGSKTLMMQLLCAGETALAFPVNFNQATEAMKKGCPSNWVAIQPQTQRPPFIIALAPNAPNASAAKVFIDFLLSKESQQFMQDNIFRQSARTDVARSGELEKLKDVRVWKSDWEAIFKNRDGQRDSFNKIFNLH